MGKLNRNLLAIVAFLVIGATAALNFSESIISSIKQEHLVLPPSATITGTATVCINESPQPLITFTGLDGATPYTFTYTLNGGPNQTISTVGNNTSVTIPVSTASAGSFVYELISVTDNNNDTETVNGTATVTVTNPPSVSFTFNNGG